MKRIFSFFLFAPLLFSFAGCAHRPTADEYQAVRTELDSARKQLEVCSADKARLKEDLDESLKKLEKSSADITSGLSSTQDLLDKNIECMEENKALLKQVAKFKVITQERKDAQWRLTKANDYLAGYLEAERMNDQLYIVKGESAVKIIIPQRVLFPSPSSAWLVPKGINVIKKIAKGLNELKPLNIEVSGHTDDSPIPRHDLKVYPTHWDLAQARATSVLILLEDQGVKKDRLSAASYGSTRPIADAASEEGRAMNRRVEIVITP